MRSLNERQIEILRLVGKFNVISMEVLKFKFNISSIAIERTLKRLEERKYIKINKIFHNGDKYITLDDWGCCLMGVKFIKKINYQTLIHDNLVNFLAINEIKNKNDIKLEHELKQESFLKFEKSQSALFPDFSINDNIAVEVEVSLKNINRIRQKIIKLDISKYNKIKWFSNNKLILNKVMQNCKNNSKHEFYFFDENILHSEKLEFSNNKIFEIL